MKCLLKWILPRYVKEAGEQKKDRREERRERKKEKEVKMGRKVQGKKRMRHKDIRGNVDPIHYTFIEATRSTQPGVLPKFLSEILMPRKA